VTVIGGPDALVERGAARLLELERRWTRFAASSELSRLNAGGGRPVAVSPLTVQLVSLAVDAWRLTAGLFDPTTLQALVETGYDRSFERLPATRAAVPGRPRVPGCEGIQIDGAAGTVTLPPAVRLDLGGIGKGFAADVVSAELMAAGAAGVCVDLGGDIRVRGVDGDGEPWVIAVDNPFTPGDVLARVALDDGAVVTSSTRHRRWMMGDGERHHLIDPRTGTSCASGLASATVVGADACWSEVVAKAAVIAGIAEGMRLVSAFGLTGVLIGDDTTAHPLPGFGVFLA